MKKERFIRELHISIPTSQKNRLFSVASNHSRLFVPEPLVVNENECSENLKKDKDQEAKLPLEECTMQQNFSEESAKDRKLVKGKYMCIE